MSKLAQLKSDIKKLSDEIQLSKIDTKDLTVSTKIKKANFSTKDENRVVIGQRMKEAEVFKKSLPKFSIDSLKLIFMSTEQIKKIAVTECNSTDLDNIRGINSITMGSASTGIICSTCGSNSEICPGHIGYIDLGMSFLHFLAVDYIKLVLESICECCGKVLIVDYKKLEYANTIPKTHIRLKEIAKLASKTNTPCVKTEKCASQPNKNQIRYEFNKDDKRKIFKIVKINKSLENKAQYMKPEEIKAIFQKISQEDLKFLGFQNGATPVNFIMEVLPVIPLRNRPPGEVQGDSKNDDITTIYQDIIKKVLILKKELISPNKSDLVIDTYHNKIWFEISHLINNNDGMRKSGDTKPSSTFNARLSGKEGYCRKYSQGKNCNHTGRSVAGPGILPFGYIIIPSSFKTMTINEKVHALNILRIKKMLKNGDIIHITKKGQIDEFNVMHSLKRYGGNADLFNITIGDEVVRNMTLGEDVFVNRQPSLHRHSIIGSRVILHGNKNTVQIHMSYTSPLNGDFDGDEMNINVPQTLTARSEIRHLTSASKHIISVGNSNPMMGLVFNCPTAIYLLCKDSTKNPTEEVITLEEEMLISSLFLYDETRMKSFKQRLKNHFIKRFTCKALFSMVLPENFYYFNKKNNVEIKEGIFIQGTLTKSDINRGIIHNLYIKYGADVTGRFISEAQFILDFYLEKRGFTIPLRDMLLKNYKIVKEKIKKDIQILRDDITELENKPALTENEKEKKNNNIDITFGGIIDTVGEEMKSIYSSSAKPVASLADEETSLMTMINSGSKGDISNISRIMGLVGQHNVNGARPVRNVYGLRALSYFDPNDKSIESQGFSTRSFLEGLDPAAFFFQGEEARIGLLDTSMNTGEIGAITNKIRKSLENEMVNYDGGIIDSKGFYTSLSYDEGYSRDELIEVNFISTGKVFMPFDLHSICDELNAM